ncbi:MAG: hypothetical protein ABSB40_00175 [Nitrososphaeria archaeon]|jgi:hypothetical protein
MLEESSKTGDQEKISACSLDSLGKLYEKHPKVLFIATKEDKMYFAQKFVDVVSPDGVTIVPVQAGGSCEIIEKLGLDTPTAVLVEKGKVKDRVTLQNDDVKDTISLMKVLSEKPSEVRSCEAKLTVDGKGWGIKLEPGSPCEREISNLSKLPPSVQKYVTKHIETADK